jgi:hypothetical protein
MEEKDDLDALLDSYSKEADKAAKRVQKQQHKQQGPKSMVRAREEGLQRPLGQDNKGFQILSKLGYVEGGLGRSEISVFSGALD